MELPVNDIVRLLEDAKLQIQRNLESEGINASGRTSRSFEVVRYDGGGVMLIMGGTGERTAPLQTLEVGRPAGNVPGGFRTTKAGVTDVSNTFKAILMQWAKDKGIVGFGWGAATLLGRRIAREGTLRHRQPVDVYSSVVAEVAEKVGADAVKSITRFILKELGKK